MEFSSVNIFIKSRYLAWKQHFPPNPLIVGIGFVVAMVLVLATPLQKPDPDDWAYYHAVRNFSQGHFTVDNRTQLEQARETVQAGGALLQYLPLDYNKWALEKEPGVVFYLVPFWEMGNPRGGNGVVGVGGGVSTAR